MYEKEIGADYGDVSGDAELLAEFTARVNLALDEYLLLWAKSAGTWQGDDTNFTNYPIITANIVSGKRDYPFTTDDGSNQIKDVSSVLILPSSTATDYIELPPIDELKTSISQILVNTNTGTPFQYGKLANAVFLDAIPDYDVDNGLKMVVNREGSHFTSSDTTKVPGIPSYHEYLYLKPAYEKACIKSLPNLVTLEKKIVDLEGSERLGVTGKIQEFFSQREKDVRHVMTPKKILYI
jgi:hypothetical protein